MTSNILQPPFHNLPGELVNRIVGLVDSDACSRLVSRVFQDSIDADLKCLMMDRTGADLKATTVMRSLLRRVARLTQLTTCYYDVLPDVSTGLLSLTLTLPQNSRRDMDLAHVARFRALKHLQVMHSAPVRDISSLQSCVHLQTLVLNNRKSKEKLCYLTDVSSIASLPALRSLSLIRCQLLTDIRPLSSCTALTSLSLAHCKLLVDISPLSCCLRLQSLDLSHPIKRHTDRPRGPRDVSALGMLVQLHTLHLQSCRVLTDIDPLLGCTALTLLDITECDALRSLPALGGLNRLTDLSMCLCDRIQHIVSLPACMYNLAVYRCGSSFQTAMLSLVNLQVLSIADCQDVSDMSFLSDLARLTILSMNDLCVLVDLTPLSSCTALVLMRILFSQVFNPEVHALDLRPMASLRNLRQLQLENCPDIVDISPLAQCSQLTGINLINCPGILDPYCMAGLPACVVSMT